MAANRYDLYGDTPVAYIDAPDPATRARALQASIYVYDWINQPNDGPSIDALKKASTDPDPMVRDLAAQFSADLYYDGVIGLPAKTLTFTTKIDSNLSGCWILPAPFFMLESPHD